MVDSAFDVPAGWQPIGVTINTRYSMAAPDLMVVYPHPSQDSGARKGNRELFFGLTKPKVQTRVVDSIDSGLQWLREHAPKESR